MIMNKDWLTGEDVLAEYGFTARYMQRLRSERRLPFSKVGKVIRYNRSDLEKLLAANRIEAER